MERVTAKVAKALKETGYPIEIKSIEEAEKLGWQGKAFFTGTCTCGLRPYAVEVWLWLWRKKKIIADIGSNERGILASIWTSEMDKIWDNMSINYSDPEEAIIWSIEYLVEH